MNNLVALPETYWNETPEELFAALQCSAGGLTTQEAEHRLEEIGPNLLKPKKQVTRLNLFLNQFNGPIVLILLSAAIISTCVETGQMLS